MMSTRIVITGVGVVSPYGVGVNLLWQQVLAGTSAVQPLSGFDVSPLRCRVGGQVKDLLLTDYLPARQLRRIDRFTALALIAAQQALAQAGWMSGDAWEPRWKGDDALSRRVGLTVGNALGGWEFAERELGQLWREGPQAVSPYMAIAWFPAAAQGNLSIAFGIRGLGRTFQQDRVSGALALKHAAECLLDGRADVMLAGGTEAPFASYACLCLETSGLLAEARDTTDAAYRPFDMGHRGLVLGEGAAFLVLERADEAERRGAPILGELAGWGITHDGCDVVHPAPNGVRFATAMRQALARAEVHPAELDAVFAAASAVPDEDVSEARAIGLALGEEAERVLVSAPKAAFGNLLGAALPMDVALAVQALHARYVPPTLHLEQPAPGCEFLDLVAGQPAAALHVNTCLINARGMGGTNAALIVRRA